MLTLEQETRHWEIWSKGAWLCSVQTCKLERVNTWELRRSDPSCGLATQVCLYAVNPDVFAWYSQKASGNFGKDGDIFVSANLFAWGTWGYVLLVNGNVTVMVGLDELRGLFQPYRFYGHIKNMLTIVLSTYVMKIKLKIWIHCT